MIKSRFKIEKNLFPSVMRGVSVSGVYFRVIITEPDQEYPRIGVIIAKKYIKLAVTRNKIKRTIFRIISNHFSQLPHKNFIFLMTQKIPKEAEKTTDYGKRLVFLIQNDTEQIINKIVKKYEKDK